MTLCYQKLGQGPPILILPGLLGSADNWLSLAKKLAPYYTLYLVDHRNHGQSFHSEIMTYEAMVEDLKHLMTQQGIVDPVLIGHSMGGKVAMTFAQNYPEALHKLIVVDIAPRAYDMKRLSIMLQILKKTPLKDVRARKEVDKHLCHYIPETLIRLYCMKNLRRDAQGMLVWSSNMTILANSIAHLERAIDCQAPFYKPTLFVKADQSDYIQTQDLPLIKAVFPNYVLKHIEHAGHWVNHTQPKALLEIIAHFLRG